MNILGITYGSHSCGISLIKDGKIIFCFEEERFSRIKAQKDFENNFLRFPVLSTKFAKEKFLDEMNNIDFITSCFALDEIMEKCLNSCGLLHLKDKFIQAGHHQSHCNLAYFLSNFQEDAFVVSIDASGNNHSAKFFIGKNGNLQYISGIDLSRKSIGHYYAMLTEFLGWKRLKDEGKVVGMSSHGRFNEKFYSIFDKSIKIDGLKTDLDLGSKCALGGIYKDFYNNFFTEFGSSFFAHRKADIAFNGQLVFEEKILQLFDNLHKMYPSIKKAAVAGGVFANVKVNKRLNELPWLDEVFVAPPMGDEGLPLGCCFATYKLFENNFKPFRVNDMFWGAQFSDSEVENIFWDKNKFERHPYNENEIALELAKGKIVGIAWGRVEYGPRALCNRSIIANPSIPGTYDRINKKLQRNDFMPFAPVVIDNYADKVFKIEKSKYTAEFMTMLYDTRDEWADKIPAVVHPIDKTARIQIVTEQSNPKFYKLINKFNDISNIPVLLNTSFNIHEEPIICSPKEAFVHLDNDIVDILVVENFVFTKK
jgi:carbamoyltransferase